MRHDGIDISMLIFRGNLFTSGREQTGPNFVPTAGYQLVSKIYADDLTDRLPDFKVFGFVAQSGSDVVVAIRGTEEYSSGSWTPISFRFPFRSSARGGPSRASRIFFSRCGPDRMLPSRELSMPCGP